ncbi:hypothetical protein GGS21DRAFT_485978 [Xylaria nigripes]|nr:hypothetical protein GGS21DRAFT_485978 [Xylaria nigripes]
MAEPIAIVGSSCRFSGSANSPSALWKLLLQPKDLSRKPTIDRFNLNGFYHADSEHHGATNTMGSYFLDEDIRLFDTSFFNITPKEAEAIDPQHRLLLESVYEAMESAGLTIQQLQGSATAVYVGLMIRDFMDIQVRDPDYFSQYMVTGTSSALNANRISYFFDWKGPSLTVDTACSSSLVAIHQAVLGLRSGESTIACVSGSNLLLGPELFISASNMHMLSSRSRMWDISAEGYARGDGFATILLKTLSNAIRDGDHIEAVIRETGVNSDGRTMGIAMPNPLAQAALIRETYMRAGLDPLKESDRCQYFEAHGTGTQAGDPQEASAIHGAFFSDPNAAPQSQKMVVGSIKTVVGHTEGAAGIAGVLKASLALRHGVIPPNLHYYIPNPRVVPYLDTLVVPTEIMPWPSVDSKYPRRASVNSFGFGGTNAHAILESYCPDYHNFGPWMQNIPRTLQLTPAGEARECLPLPFVFSANTEEALTRMFENYAKYLEGNDSINLRELSWTLLSRRSLLPVRATVAALTASELSSKLKAEVETKNSKGSNIGLRNKSAGVSRPNILGIFTGQGAQWATMGSGLIRRSEQFAATIKKLEDSLNSLPDAPEWSLKKELMAPPSESRLSEAALSQPLCTAVQIGLVDLLRSSGVEISAAVGHSSGEIAAAYVAGVLTAEDGIRIAYYRGVHAKLAKGESGVNGSMLAAGMSMEEAEEFLDTPALKSRVSVAASNSPASVTLSGDEDAILEVKQMLDSKKKFNRQLQVDTAYHSHHMIPCSGPYIASLKACGVAPREANTTCSWVSSVCGSKGEPALEDLDAQYWSDNMTKAVLFSQALERAVVECGPFDAIIEVGPHPALKGPATQTVKELGEGDTPYTGVLDRKSDDLVAFNSALGFLWKHLGPFIDFAGYEKANHATELPAPVVLKDLPLYPWDHDHAYWRESRLSKEYRTRNTPPHALLGSRSPGSSEFELRWRNILRREEIPWLTDLKVQGQPLLPAGVYCAMILDAAKCLAGEKEIHLIELRDVQFLSPITLANDSATVEVVSSMRRLVQREVTADGKIVLEAEFSLSAGSPDGDKPLKETACSRVHIILGTTDVDALPRRQGDHKPAHLKPIAIDSFYSALSSTGLAYGGSYVGLYEAERAWHRASAVVPKRRGDEMGSCASPCFLELCIQMGYLAFAHPEDGNLWTTFLPQKIGRLAINPKIWETGNSYEDAAFETSSHVSKAQGPTASDLPSFGAHVEVYDPTTGFIQLQMEDVTFTTLSLASQSQDRELFFNTTWSYDVTDGLCPEKLHETPEDVQTRETLDKIASFYIRDLKIRGLSKGSDKAYHPLLDSTTCDLGSKSADREGKNSHAEIADLITQLQPRVDLRFMKSIGERLNAVLSATDDVESTTASFPSHYRLDTLPVFQAINKYSTSVIQAVSHRFPQLNVLEVGPECMGPSKLFDSAVGGFSSYVFASIGSGAESAKKSKVETIPITSLDDASLTERVPKGGFELVIVSYLLHGRSSMSSILSGLRAVMRPGGFILFVEPTENYNWLRFFLSGVLDPNSSLHQSQSFGSPLSFIQLDDALRKGGFSGVDDTENHSGMGIIVSQATDDKIEALRDPLQQRSLSTISGNLLLIGGQNLRKFRIFKNLTRALQGWRGKVVIEPSLEALGSVKFDKSFTAAVILSDGSDQPSSNDSYKAAMVNVFTATRSVLWVALKSEPNGNYASTATLGRQMAAQQPGVNFHSLVLENDEDAEDIIAKRLIRQVHSQSWQLSRDTHVWSDEMESKVVDGQTLIPRVLPHQELNDHLNSTRRIVEREVRLANEDVTLFPTGENGLLSYQAQKSQHQKPSHDSVSDSERVQIKYSSLLALRVGGSYVHTAIGQVKGTEKKVLVLSPTVSSAVSVKKSMLIPLPASTVSDCRVLELFMRYWVVDIILASLVQGPNVIYEPDDALASILAARSSGTGKEITFLTSERHHKTGPEIQWTYIHPRSSKADLKALVPQRAKRFINAQIVPDQTGKYILEALPQGCSVCKDNFFQISSRDSFAAVEQFHSELLAVVEKTCTETSTPMPVPWGTSQIMTASELVQTRNVPTKPFDLVDWTDVNTIPVVARPRSDFLSRDKTYVLVDLADDVAECVAHWLSMCGASHIAVFNRTTNAKSGAWAGELRRFGVRIDFEQSDLRTKIETERLLERFPLAAGVVCLAPNAGSPDSGIDQAVNIDQTFNSQELEFFILLAGQDLLNETKEQSKVAECLDALVMRRKARGLCASVVSVPEILGVNSTATASQDGCFVKVAEEHFHILMNEAVSSGHPKVQGSPRVITGLKRITPTESGLPAWRLEPKYSHLVRSAKDSGSNGKSSAQGTKQQVMESGSPEAATKVLLKHMKEYLRLLLGLAVESIKDDIDLVTLGIDSLMASEVRSWFLKEIDVDVSVLQVLGGSTISELCAEGISLMQYDFAAGGAPESDNVPPPAPKAQAEVPAEPKAVPPAPPSESSASSASWTPIMTEDVSSSRTAESSTAGDDDDDDVSKPDIVREGEMSFAQTRLWFPSEYLDQKTPFNCTTSYRISGRLDLPRLDRALKQVVQRHEIFRTSFITNSSTGQPMQFVHAESRFNLKTFSGNETTDVEEEFRRTAEYVFNLEQGDSFIASVISHSSEKHTIVFGYHHIIMDGVSWQITLNDMASFYNNQADQLRPPTQYLDFAMQTTRLVKANAHEKKLAFWKKEFQEVPEPLPLFPFASVTSRKALTQYKTLDVVRHIDTKLVASIKKASLGAKTTSFHFYLAAFQAMLHTFLGIEDVCIGIIDANRTDQAFLRTVGFLLDLLPLNLRLNGKERFTTTMTNTRNKVYSALSNSGVPLEAIIKKLQVKTASTHTPLFQVLINYRMGALKAPGLGEADMSFLDYEDAKAPFDIALSIDEKDDGTGMLTFSTQDYLYDQSAMTLIVETYIRFLDILSQKPSLRLSEIPPFDDALIQRGLEVGTGKTVDFGWPATQTVAHRIDHWMETQPNAIAVKDTLGQSLTYQQMSQRVNAIAYHLKTSAGVKAGAAVAVFCEPQVDSICCILAVQKLGAAYIPLDVRNASERLAAVVEEGRPAAILIDNNTKERLEPLNVGKTPILNVREIPQSVEKTLPQEATLSGNALILYTSGSTGRPKGIVLSHQNLATNCAAMGERLSLDRDVILQQSGLGFDASIAQIFYALVFGGTIIMGNNRGDPAELAELIEREKVTITLIMISEMSSLLDHGTSILSRCNSWRLAMCGGEAFTMNLVRKFQKLDLPKLKLINAYGPTETSIISSIGEVPYRTAKLADDHRVPVGPPIPNYGVYVLDDKLQPVPIGWPGELCIAGPGVAAGYLGLEELTASKFRPDTIRKPGGGPFDGWNTVYRTGDRARLLSDGSFVFLGRIDGDSQVKLRGIRIELDEITDALLRTADGVLANAATLVRGESSKVLVSYVVFSQDKGAAHKANPDYLRQLLLSLPLPIYMRPAVAVPVDVLPFTERGKLDVKALSAVPLVRFDLEETESLTECEAKLKLIWEDVLTGVDVGLRITKKSDFFSVGGNSLLLMRLRAQIQKDFGVSLPLASLFQASTLELLAAGLATETAAGNASGAQAALLDWEQETQLPVELTSKEIISRFKKLTKPKGQQQPIEVVLTGSTGFLGSEVLHQLVTNSNVAKIHCIAVRPGRSVRSALAASSKVISYTGNLADPQLGLTDKQAEVVFAKAAAIIHNGAEVSHMKAYQSLRTPNVGSTKELLRLCALHTKGALPSFHYVSSAGVGHLVPVPATQASEEKFPSISLAPYPPPRDGSDGYVSAKWASEQTLERAAATVPGLRVVVHRPSNVTGDDVGDRDIVHSVMRYSIAMKASPDMSAATGAFDFIGVDACAAGIIDAVLNENSSAEDRVRYEHRSGGLVVPVGTLSKYLGERCGQPELPVVSWPEWLERAQAEGLDELVSTFLKEVNGHMRMPLLVDA